MFEGYIVLRQLRHEHAHCWQWRLHACARDLQGCAVLAQPHPAFWHHRAPSKLHSIYFNVNAMPYRYTPLLDQDLRIQLLTLQPWEFKDSVESTLHRSCLLDAPSVRPTQRLTMKRLRKTLPEEPKTNDFRIHEFSLI